MQVVPPMGISVLIEHWVSLHVKGHPHFILELLLLGRVIIVGFDSFDHILLFSCNLDGPFLLMHFGSLVSSEPIHKTICIPPTHHVVQCFLLLPLIHILDRGLGDWSQEVFQHCSPHPLLVPGTLLPHIECLSLMLLPLYLLIQLIPKLLILQLHVDARITPESRLL